MAMEDRAWEIDRQYRQALAEFGPVELWNMQPVECPTEDSALAMTQARRTHGSMDGRRSAERTERLCRAAA